MSVIDTRTAGASAGSTVDHTDHLLAESVATHLAACVRRAEELAVEVGTLADADVAAGRARTGPALDRISRALSELARRLREVRS